MQPAPDPTGSPRPSLCSGPHQPLSGEADRLQRLLRPLSDVLRSVRVSVYRTRRTPEKTLTNTNKH